jgi:hypothetical protein
MSFRIEWNLLRANITQTHFHGVTSTLNGEGQRLGQNRWLEAVAAINRRNKKWFMQESQRFLLDWHGGSDFEDDVSILRLHGLGRCRRRRPVPEAQNNHEDRNKFRGWGAGRFDQE